MLLELLQLSTAQIVFSIIIIFLAYTVKGLSGFGSGLIAIPLLAFMFPLVYIVPVLGLLSYSGTIMQSYQLRKQVIWKDIIPVLPFSVIGIIVATWMLVNVDARLLVMLLAIFIFIYSIYAMLPMTEYACGRRWAVVAGSLGGLVGALFGTGGPFYVVYLKLRQLDKNAFRASIVMIFLVDGGVRIIAYTLSGLYTEQVLLLVAVLLPVLFVGMYVGHHVHIKIDQKRFNQIINILLMLSSLALLYKSIS